MLALDPSCPPPPSLVSLAPSVLPSVDPALSRPPGPWDTSSNVTPHRGGSSSPSPPPCLPASRQDGPGREGEDEESLGRASICDLPPELLARVLTHVGLIGGPAALRLCSRVCRGFHDVIEDPAADKYIYKAAALSLFSYDSLVFPPPSLLGTRVPPTPTTAATQKQTYKALTRSLFLTRQPFPPKVHSPQTTCIEGTALTTRTGPHPAIHDRETLDDAFHRALSAEKAAGPLPPMVNLAPYAVTRIIDFVHTCTESSRTDYRVPYVGVKTCGWSDSLPPGASTSLRQGEAANWVFFSDDPRLFPDQREESITIQRAAIVGGTILPPKNGKTYRSFSRMTGQILRKRLFRGASPTEGQGEKAGYHFIKPVDNDRFMSTQRRGPPEMCINASIYKTFGPQVEKRPGRGSQGQTGTSEEGWFTVDKATWANANVNDHSLVGYGKSLLHSDANLRLVPRLVDKHLEVAAVERLAMVDIGKGDVAVNMSWEMPKSAKELSLVPGANQDNDAWDDDPGDDDTEDIRVNWEFKSCGEHLIVCDDSSGRRPSTMSCFSGRVPGSKRPASTSDLKWQRKMVVKRPVPTEEYWLDNDGIEMNSSVCAYATRRHIAPGTGVVEERYYAVMEFHIVSLLTGDTIKILNLADEERAVGRNCYMWCSFALGDGILVGSVGGVGWDLGARRNYGYESLFLWELGGSTKDPPEPTSVTEGGFRGDVAGDVSMTGPTSRIPLPVGWGEKDKYVVLSGCGRFLGATAERWTAAWDLEEKSFLGVWCIPEHTGGDEGSLIRRERSWNGLWIKWRDVKHIPGSLEPYPVSSGLSFMSFRSLVRAVTAQNDAAEYCESLTEPEALGPAEAGNGGVAGWWGS